MVIAWLRGKWRQRREHARLVTETRPESLRAMTAELRELAQMVGTLRPAEDALQERIRRIKDEMEQLDRLLSRPEFKRLSMKRRLQLRDGLLQSKAQLLETMQTAPSPTTLLQ